jgi:hypothetical protein
MVGLSSTALASSFASSGLGQALVTSGQLDALRRVIDALPTSAISPKILEALQKTVTDAVPPVHIPQSLLPQLDLSSILKGLDASVAVNLEPIRTAIASVLPTWYSKPMTAASHSCEDAEAATKPQPQEETS